MTNFKSGSGDLDFGGDSADDEDEAEDEQAEAADATAAAESAKDVPGDTRTERSDTDDDGAALNEEATATASSSAVDYPYFVRRSNVMDERDQRIEVHLRPEISSQEAAFRTELAAALGTDTVPKTDAREFALKFAFQHPEDVAELMAAEGFGVLD